MTVEIIEAENISKPTMNRQVMSAAYHNNRCVWLMPTRGMIPLRVHVSLRNLAWMPNTPRCCSEVEGLEVAAAYNELITRALVQPHCAPMPFVWTYEEDNVQPPDVFLKLFEAIWKCIDCGAPMPPDVKGNPTEPWRCENGHRGLDAVAGLYYTKTEPKMPMALGDPKSGELEFRPRDVREAETAGDLIEVNGVAMGCTLWRKSLFERVSQPWFKTLSGAEPGHIPSHTQDLYFCRKAKEELGAEHVRFAVHCGVAVGHLDVETGEVF